MREQGASLPLHPLKGQGISFAARLRVSLEGRAQRPDGLLETVGALLVFGERKMRGRYTRAGSASLHLFKGRWGWLDVSIEGRAWLNVAYLQLEVRDRRARAGSIAPLHPLKGWRGSFAVRLGVSIEGSACWFAFDELYVACLRNRRCAAIARGRGASCPCIPTRGGEVLLLRGWAFS